jgi:hypothetical protein
MLAVLFDREARSMWLRISVDVDAMTERLSRTFNVKGLQDASGMLAWNKSMLGTHF